MYTHRVGKLKRDQICDTVAHLPLDGEGKFMYVKQNSLWLLKTSYQFLIGIVHTLPLSALVTVI